RNPVRLQRRRSGNRDGAGGPLPKEHLMADNKPLEGKRVAFLATDGVEQVELTQPWEAVEQAGGKPVLVSLEKGTIQGFNHLDKGDTFDVDLAVDDAEADDFDALVLPGGVANPDQLRMNEQA